MSRFDLVAASQLPNSYKAASKYWRHSLHSVCSRIAMFPASLVQYFLLTYTRPGDIVADCWAGVGTAPLQAELSGRVGVGNDISPEAFAVMRAKLQPPNTHELSDYLGSLKRRITDSRLRGAGLDALGYNLNIPTYYNSLTLREILVARELIEHDLETSRSRSRVVLFTRAMLLGILHGDRLESLSLPLDSAKALSAGHVRKMQGIDPVKYAPVYKRNIVDSLRIKAGKVFRDAFTTYRGIAKNTDAGKFELGPAKAKLLITSPPYLGTHTYAYDNRIRLWFLGVDYRIFQRRLFNTWDEQRYFSEVASVIENADRSLAHDSACILAMGDVRKKNGQLATLGSGFAEYWSDRARSKLDIVKIITDRGWRKKGRYFDVDKPNGVRTERIIVLEKGRPKKNKVSVDWSIPFAKGWRVAS